MQQRIKLLDSFRTIAIVMVILYHYLYCFNSQLYTIKNINPSFFKYGYLGVQLFFIISGFVITLSLKKSLSFFEFVKNRFIRLFPAMFFCSMLTFIFCNVFDTKLIFPAASSITNLILSNTFMPPVIVNHFLDINFQYVDPPYWSLWVEIQFYFVAAITYFSFGKHFNHAIFIFLLALFGINYCSSQNFFFNSNFCIYVLKFAGFFNLFIYAVWFLSGILFEDLFNNSKNFKGISKIILCFAIILLTGKNTMEQLFTVLFFTLFFIFIYKDFWLQFLLNPIFTKIGISSYAVYLIHQTIGTLLISKSISYFGAFGILIPTIMMVTFFTFGVFYYKYAEIFLLKKLKVLLFSNSTPQLMSKK